MEPTFTPPAPTSNRRGPLTVGIGIALLAGLFMVGLVPKLHNDEKLRTAAQDVTNAPLEVELTHPRVAPAQALELPGSIQAFSETAVQARTSGYVKKLYVDIGSHVKAGQVLADIEAPDADLQTAQAFADTAKSRATVGQSVADVVRLKAGVSQTQANVAQQLAAIKQSEAAVAGDRAKLAQTNAARSQASANLAQARRTVDVQRANLSQTQAQYDLAAATVKRYAGLLKEGFVAQQDYDQAVAAYKSAAASVEAAKSSVQASEASVLAAQQAVESQAALVQSAQADLDAATESVHAAKAGYESLQAAVAAAQAGVDASRSTVVANQAAVTSSVASAKRFAVISSFEHVTAPFDGVITARNVDVGSLVSPGVTTTGSTGTTPSIGLLGFERDDTVRIFINVPQSEVQSIHPGLMAKVAIQELPHDTFEGTVVQSSGALSESSRTRLTEIRVANPKGILLPGMYAQVSISPPSARQSILVPANTLMIDSQGTRIAVLDAGNVVHIRSVRIGKDYGAETEILTGIEATDRLISNPSDELREGMKVEVSTSGSDNGAGGATGK